MSKTDDRLEWFKCRQSLLLGALAAMEPDEGYLYCIIIFRIYEVNGPCPDDARALSLRTHIPVRRIERAVEALTGGTKPKLRRVNGGLINGFAEEELDDRRELRKARQKSGKEGAQKRWPKIEENQRSDDGKSQSKNRQDPTELEIELEKKDSPSGESSPASVPTMFGSVVFATDAAEILKGAPKPDDWPTDHLDLFWHAYPPQRRTEKRKVAAKLNQLRKSRAVTWQKLMEGLERYKRSRDVQRGFAKGPMPWLNGGCWDDEIGAGPEAAGQPKHKMSALTRIALGLEGEDDDGSANGYDGPTLDLRPIPDPR